MCLDDLVFMIYMFGMIGQLKGVLYGYWVLLGYMFGIGFFQNGLGWLGDCFWMLVDWVWVGGLLNVFFLVFFFGVLVVFYVWCKFDLEKVFYFVVS